MKNSSTELLSAVCAIIVLIFNKNNNTVRSILFIINFVIYFWFMILLPVSGHFTCPWIVADFTVGITTDQIMMEV
ncbi:MAG: hypothetical protein EOL88_06450 [Bacteroidia bacterium]|nr:hypothetical protein [Bacteroidales bacterium]NCD41717.1 hypothetical protein [Bacteroidia bacterium]